MDVKEKQEKVKEEKVKEKKIKEKKIKEKKVKEKKVKEKKIKDKNVKNAGVLSERPRVKKLRKSLKIRTRILLCFMIPVALIVVLGVISYKKSASNLTEAYEVAAVQSISAVGDYLSFGMENVSATASECLTYAPILDYAKMISYTTADGEYGKARTDIKKYLSMKQVVNKFIGSVTMIPSAGFGVISTNAILETDGFFGELSKDEKFNFKSLDGEWIRQHSDMDEKFGNAQDPYLCSFYRKFPSARAALFIDINYETVRETMSGLNYGDGSMIALILPDGSEEYYSETKADAGFMTGVCEYAGISEKEENSGFSYYTKDGEKYLFVYCKTNSGYTLCALVPENNIIGEVNSLGILTVVLVAIGAVLAVAAGILLSTNISRNIKKLTSKLDLVAQGDFTVEFGEGSTDEFGHLTRNVKGTVGNIRKLINHVAEVTRQVEESSGNVTEKSANLKELARQVSDSTARVSETVESEAFSAQKCVEEMDVLSQKIERASDNIIGIRDFAVETSEAISQNIESMNDLVEKSDSSSQIMGSLLTEIESLKQQAASVNEFIEVIGGIASQTNLLSLNASIEASRAGESGRGFSVVAEEIRKLADQTSKAANEIKKCAVEINEQAQTTAGNVHRADEIVRSQNDISVGLIENLTTTKGEINNLMNKINDINDDMKDMSGTRAVTIDSISNISASTEEAFSLTSLVNQVIESHDVSSSELEEVSRELQEKAFALKEAVERFKI
ncbi:MAG: methyl-accepting chemotaxis protein [Lachnospiraceae bacterium]|nr:methyl-accepting chemotaxis protein [Lachnospiraceae bacterium]